MISSTRVRQPEYLLGLDLGAASLGWAIFGLQDGEPSELRDVGVRIFSAGVEGSIEDGKDASRATERRQKRLARRQLWRRGRRLARVFHVLQQYGLLPPGAADEPEQRHAILQLLDADLRTRYLSNPRTDTLGHHTLPYRLRAWALERALEPFELGRALYHLAQRRGFLSNRVAEADEGDDERSVVKSGIQTLQEALAGRTLGQYFAAVDPTEERIRRRWTARAMYRDEFDRIIAAQREHQPILRQTVEVPPRAGQQRNRSSSARTVADVIGHAIFFQRPLKSQRGLIGKCSLERDEPRCPLAYPVAQESRMLQTVNHLVLRGPMGETRLLSAEQRHALRAALDQSSTLSFTKARKAVGAPRGWKFTLEDGSDDNLKGNRTAADFRRVFGADVWDAKSRAEQTSIVHEVLHYQKPEALAKRAIKIWGLPAEAAQLLAFDVRLEPGYGKHSALALERMLPYLLEGAAYMSARRAAYPDHLQPGDAYDSLPPVLEKLSDLRNPAVLRALSELRRVVNAIIRRYGKPAVVRLEMARDLKRSRKDRQEFSKRNFQQQKRRERAIAAMQQEFSRLQPKHADIEKWLLAEECNWECPYTGQRISAQTLLGSQPQFDVEHIFPRRYLDDSFLNKTLCWHEENRHVKRDRLPHEAYAAQPERWQEILDRVQCFSGPQAEAKLRRFQSQQVPDDFVQRQLNDTRYNSVAAAEYLALLYGGRWDANGRQRVQVATGGLTALLRRNWRLEGFFGREGKTRDDHRHHAIDAIVIGLTGPRAVQQLESAAAEASRLLLHRTVAELSPPLENLREVVQERLAHVRISLRPERRLAGPLHAETNYSPERLDEQGKPCRHIRKPLSSLSAKNVEEIVDPVVRSVVAAHLAAHGNDVKKAFADAAHHPCLTARDGRQIPIHRVRIAVRENTKTVGRGARARHVASGKGTNHHVVVYAELDALGNEKRWKMVVVDRLTALDRLRRKQNGEPVDVIQRDFGPQTKFKFSLINGDCLVAQDENGQEMLYRLSKMSANQLQFWEHWRAQPDNTQRNKWNCVSSADNLRTRNARKVQLDCLGGYILAND